MRPVGTTRTAPNRRNQSRVAVLEGGLKVFPQILRRPQMLGGIPGKCFKRHLCPPSPALWRVRCRDPAALFATTEQHDRPRAAVYEVDAVSGSLVDPQL
jgi:hypothetical protein